eukprot:scaffold97016_cov17-Tisochrysis_lutea.AAC.1
MEHACSHRNMQGVFHVTKRDEWPHRIGRLCWRECLGSSDGEGRLIKRRLIQRRLSMAPVQGCCQVAEHSSQLRDITFAFNEAAVRPG